MSEMLDIINTILFWIFLYVLLWQAYYLLFNRGIPNITTAPAIRRSIIKKLKDFKQTTPIIYDLGCGNGKFTREIARALPHAQVTGIEIDSIAYWKAKLLETFQRRPNLKYIHDDFYNQDLSQADIIFFFLVGRDMSFIRDKLEQNLKKGAYIITNKFQLGGNWQPLETISVKTLAPAQKTFYIYQKQ